VKEVDDPNCVVLAERVKSESCWIFWR
jgi:hypothetical protein